MAALIIRHVANTDPAQFHVVRQTDGKTTPDPAVVPSPVGFPVEGRPNTGLLRELRWYLEVFLDYPFPPETDHAERVEAALRDCESGRTQLPAGVQRVIARHPNQAQSHVGRGKPRTVARRATR